MTLDNVDNLTCDLHMTLGAGNSATRILKLFTSQGWTWRNCSWDEYEINAQNIAELIITSSDPILISGGVARNPNAIELIETILDNGKIDFEFDLFDEAGKLIRSRPNT